MSMITSETFWGCELSSTSKSAVWSATDFDEDDFDDESVEHKLIIGQACLGASAKPNERNIVQVTVREEGVETPKTYTILSLKLGLNEQCTLSLGFTNEVTFELVSGSGPVHLVGAHLLAIQDDINLRDTEDYDEAGIDSEDDEFSELESEEEEVEEEELAPVLGNGPVKRNLPVDASATKSTKTKVSKKGILKTTEEYSGSDDDSDDLDEDEKKPDTPQKKVTFAEKVQVKKIAGKAADKKTPKASTQEVKNKLKEMKSRPKSLDKFKNLMSNQFKITDQSVINDLWTFSQKLGNK